MGTVVPARGSAHRVCRTRVYRILHPDQTKTLKEGAIVPWNPISSQYYPQMLEQFCKSVGIDMDTPFNKLSKKQQQQILYGNGETPFHFHYENDFGGIRDVDVPFEGVINNISRRYREIGRAHV